MKKVISKRLSIILAMIMCVSLFLPLNTLAAGKPSEWAQGQVDTAISAGLVPQSLQSQYAQPVTRAEFAVLAVAVYEKVAGKEITERTQFLDTTDTNVEKAAAVGIAGGTGNNNFSPNAGLTREQAAAMLSRLAEAVGKPLAKQPATFVDNGAISSWALEAVGQIQNAEIMGGVGNNTFSPQGDYTREQSIITALRLYDFVTAPASSQPAESDAASSETPPSATTASPAATAQPSENAPPATAEPTTTIAPTAVTEPTTTTVAAPPTTEPTTATVTPANDPSATTPTQNQSITVYITRTGEKYHLDGCRYLSRSKIPISLDDARQYYGPCSVCKPPQ